jgi:hypothetical protein
MLGSPGEFVQGMPPIHKIHGVDTAAPAEPAYMTGAMFPSTLMEVPVT